MNEPILFKETNSHSTNHKNRYIAFRQNVRHKFAVDKLAVARTTSATGTAFYVNHFAQLGFLLSNASEGNW